MKCKDCGFWGGSDSKGSYRKCYQKEAMSNTKPELKHSEDTCGWRKRDHAKAEGR